MNSDRKEASGKTRRPLGLGARLALAFGGLFLAISAASAGLAAWRAGAAAERAYRGRMESLARGLSEAGFAVNRDLLVKMKSILAVDVASFDPAAESAGLVSSLPPVEHAKLVDVLVGEGPPYIKEEPEAYVPGPVARTLPATSGPGCRYQVFGAWQSVAGERKMILLLVPQEEIDRVRGAAATPVLLAALAGALAAVVLAGVLASTVSRPVRRLADQAGRAAEGGDFEHVSGGGRELEELSESLERMTEALARSRSELVKSERAAAAGQMAVALAHEVRNPLTGAKMTVEMLLDDEGRASAREALESVLEELRRLEMVVDELVSFARPSPPVFAKVDLEILAREVLAFMRRQLEHARVQARLDCAPGPPPALPARADANKTKQVLVNLVLNAMQAQARGGQINIEIAAAGEGRVAIEVADRGPGVEPGELEKIFTPFYTTKQGGAGLGLSVSRRIAEEHGGTLSCREREGGGGGAVFRLELAAWKGKS